MTKHKKTNKNSRKRIETKFKSKNSRKRKFIRHPVKRRELKKPIVYEEMKFDEPKKIISTKLDDIIEIIKNKGKKSIKELSRELGVSETYIEK